MDASYVEGHPRLLERLKRREGAAQLELRRSVLPKMVATAQHYLRDEARAEEIAEDVWLDFVLDYVDRIRDERAINRYLHMMTVSRAVRLRRLLRRCEPPSERNERTTDPTHEVIEQIDRPAMVSRLHRCVEALGKKKRRMLRMRFYGDQTFTAIGEALGVSRVYAGRAVREAIEQLTRCMREAA